MNEALPQRAQFHHMKEGTQSDWEIIGAEFSEFRSTVVNRIKDHLLLLQGDFGGFSCRSFNPLLADRNIGSSRRQG